MDEIKPGTYRLRETFVNSKIDKRLSGYALRSSMGLPKRTRIVIRPWRGSDRTSLSIEAPDYRGNEVVVHFDHNEDEAKVLGWSTTSTNLDLERLIGLLEPADDDTAWLRTTLEQPLCWADNEDVILQLLLAGKIKRADIIEAIEAERAAQEKAGGRQ